MMAAVEDFEERDTLKNLDMIEGDHDALVAGGDPTGMSDEEEAEAASDGGAVDGHDHDHDHADHEH
jgi:hypothetical protein